MAILTSPYWFNVNNYKSQIVGLFNSKTNHYVQINGEIKASIFPNISIILNDVSIKKDKFDKTSIFDAKKLVLDVKTLPLFEKKIEVKNMHLVEADFVLVVNNDKKELATNEVINSEINQFDRNKISDIDKNFRLDSLILKDCSVKIIDESKNSEIYINPINLQTSYKPGKNKISISAILNSTREDKISLDGHYSLVSSALQLSNFVINFNDLYAKGEMLADFSSKKPDISLKLNSSKINLDKIIEHSQSGGERLSKGIGKSNSEADDSVNLAFLNNFDANFQIDIDGIKYKKFDISKPISINGKIENEALDATLNIDSFYSGSFNSFLKLENNNRAKYQFNTKIANVDLSKLPKFNDKFDVKKGVLNYSSKVNSFGDTKHQINRNLSGKADFNITNSELKSSGFVSKIIKISKIGSSNTESEQLKFDKMSSSFDIKNAIATSDDFKLISDVVNCKGDGVIDLYNKSLEFKFTPKYSNDLDKKTGRTEIPVIVYGSLNSPKVKIDSTSTLLNIIKDPAEAQEMIDKLKKDFKNKNSIEDIRNLFKN